MPEVQGYIRKKGREKVHMLGKLRKNFTEEVTFSRMLSRSLSGREQGKGNSKDQLSVSCRRDKFEKGRIIILCGLKIWF